MVVQWGFAKLFTEVTMKFPRIIALGLLLIPLVLTACGGGTTSTAAPTPTEAEQVAMLSPTPTIPAEPTLTPEPTHDPNVPATGGSLSIGILKEPKYISPLMTSNAVGQMASTLMLEGLVGITPEGSYEPVLAADLPVVSEDGLTVTYTLKEGIQFSDGDVLTCEDVQFTWKAILSPAALADKTGYELINSIECPDEQTVVVSFNEVYPDYLRLFNFIVPETAGELGSLASWGYHTAPIGTGPWKVAEWQIGDHITLRRNPYFREEGKPYLDSVILKFFPNWETGLEMLRDGEIDVNWNLGETDIPTLKGLSAQGIHFESMPSGESEMLLFNLADPKANAPLDTVASPHPILSDPSVRQAIQLGIDKHLIVESLLGGNPEVSSSALAAERFGCAMGTSEYNPEKAKALLEEAGWKAGVDGIREKNGGRLSLKVTAEEENRLRGEIEAILVEQMKALGIELVVENVPHKEFYANWESVGLRKRGFFDTILHSNGGLGDPVDILRRDYHSSRIPTIRTHGNGNNFARYSNAEVDAWLDEAAHTMDEGKRNELICKALGQIAKDVPVVYLYERLLVSAYDERLQNLRMAPGPGIFTYRSQDWWVRP